MSKGSLFWSKATGKLGDTVLYRSGGEQRTRTYVAKIKNPKSKAQMENRILMNNVISMFRGYKNILTKSFPNRKANQSGFNAFVQANKNVVGYAISKDAMEYGTTIPGGLIIAKGDIQINTTPTVQSLPDWEEPDASPRYFAVIQGLLPTPVLLENLDSNIASADYAQGIRTEPSILYKILTSNGNPLGLPTEFKITVVGGAYLEGIANEDYAGWKPSYVQYICSAVEANNKILYFGEQANWGYLTLSLAGVTKSTSTSGDSDKINLTVNSISASSAIAENDFNDVCLGVIISWTENGKQRVTNSTIWNRAMKTGVISDWAKGGFVYEQVLANYGYTQESLLSTSVETTSNRTDDPSIDQEEEVG